jgi:hypothetical protein
MNEDKKLRVILPMLSTKEKMELTENMLERFLTGLDEQGYSTRMADDKVRDLFVNDRIAWVSLAAFLRSLRGIVKSKEKKDWRRN